MKLDYNRSVELLHGRLIKATDLHKEVNMWTDMYSYDRPLIALGTVIMPVAGCRVEARLNGRDQLCPH